MRAISFFSDDRSTTAACSSRGYEFSGTSLKLKSPSKPDRVYKATYLMMGPKLELTIGDKKETMKKQ